MAIKRHYLACDLGAESGRVMLGVLDSGRLELEELHRFPNEPVHLPTGLYWDTHRLFREIVRGLTVAGRQRHIAADGIGIDTWGVDFGFLDAKGALSANPRHYRDPRTNGMLDRAFAVVPRDEIYAATGAQFMQLNSLYQWLASKLENEPALTITRRLLFMPDLLNYWLTGEARAEITIASTSQFYNPATHSWATGLLERLGLDASILPDLVETGARLGTLLPHLADATGLESTPVFAAAGHDTAAAVAGVPASSPDGWCYISSGTWSLMGVELPRPIINDKSLQLNYTNEVGYGRSIRLLKNIAGLWVLQECRRAWEAEGQSYSYDQLTAMAAEAPAYGGYIEPDAFIEPGHMPERIVKWCAENGQPQPVGAGAMVRAILESLAQRYHQVLLSLEEITGKPIHTIHIVGGGSRNRLLNQLVADRTGRVVLAGPSEATAIGNVLIQALGAGHVGSLAEARQVVRDSFPLERFEPRR